MCGVMAVTDKDPQKVRISVQHTPAVWGSRQVYDPMTQAGKALKSECLFTINEKKNLWTKYIEIHIYVNYAIMTDMNEIIIYV